MGNPRNFALIAEEIVERAGKAGANLAEAYLLQAKELTIEVANGAVETLKLAEDQGVGVRVFKGQRMGFAYSSDLSQQALEETIRQALENSEKTEKDQFNTMPTGDYNYPQLDIFDAQIQQVSIEDKIKLAKEIETIARAADPRIKITETSAYSDSEYTVTIVNSSGVKASYQGTYCAAYAFIVAEENGDSQNGFGLQYALKYSQINPETIGKEAAMKAVRMLGAKTIHTQKTTIVLDPKVATSFLGVLAPALSADAVQKGKSLFAGKVGQTVASPLLNITDHGCLSGAVMSAPFDGEGVPTSETVLIKDGVLQGFLYNSYTAAKAGVKSTGNGSRGSFKGTPEVGVTNFYIQPGQLSSTELCKGVEQGLYITEVLGMHTANPISGDFSIGVSGLWLEKGVFTYPVRGVTVAGNLLELLSQIQAVANDLNFIGSKGSPTIRIDGIMLSGH
jgi:PmbA protein